MVAAAATATAMIYKFTYTLGRSLYVPLTSKCNSISLPQTRGTGFLLPKNVAIPLINVRDAEDPGFVPSDIYNNYEESDEPVSLPPYNFPLVNTLYHQFSNNDISKHLQEQREIITDAAAQGTKENNEYNSQVVDDDMLQPSIATLINEVSTRLESAGNVNNFDQVVLAGEDESTLRMDAVLAVAQCVKAFRGKEVQDSSSSSSSSSNSTTDNKPTRQSSDRRFVPPDKLPVRVITNGLSYGNVNFGYSPYNTKRNGVIAPMHRHVILRDMMEAGISRLSVALNTANRHEYDLLMEPCCYTGGGLIQHGGVDGEDTVIDQPSLLPGTAHDLVCEFILEAVKLGMDVEITGIDRPGIDKVETERLARLLLSVGPDKFKRRRMVRWRRYFD